MSTNTMSTTDILLTEILNGLSPPPILGSINKSIETLNGSFIRFTEDFTDFTEDVLEKLEPNRWLEGLNLAIGATGLGVGIAGLKGVTATGAGGAALGGGAVAGGITLSSFGLPILVLLGAILLVLGALTPITDTTNKVYPKHLTGDSGISSKNSYYNGANTAQSKALSTSISQVSGTNTTNTLSYLPMVLKAQQISLPITNQELISNDTNIAPINVSTVLASNNTSKNGINNSSTSNAVHHHQNVYNIANIDIADGIISDLEDLIQAINHHHLSA